MNSLKTEDHLTKLNELFAKFETTTDNPWPSRYRNVNADRVKVSDVRTRFGFRALCKSDAAYRIYNGKGGNSYNVFISAQFADIIK